MFKKFLPILGVGLALIMTLSAFALTSVSANTMTGVTAIAAGPGNRNGDFGGGPDNTYLAQALGVTTDQLQAAYTKAQSAELDKAVADGLITQAQVDQIKSNGLGAHGIPGLVGQSMSSLNFDQFLADALGITTTQLQTAYQTAYNARIDQEVTDGRLTQDQANLMKGEYALRSSQTFQNAMQSAYTTAVQQAVSSGVITQAQADQILKNNPSFGFPGMDGGRGGFERMPGFGGPGQGGPNGGSNTAPANPAPSQTAPAGSGSSASGM